MMGQLDLGSEESEDQFMKVMQGMMSTLLSKDVLYPSLAELRRQVSGACVRPCTCVEFIERREMQTISAQLKNINSTQFLHISPISFGPDSVSVIVSYSYSFTIPGVGDEPTTTLSRKSSHSTRPQA